MITPGDELYQQTKRLKRTGASLDSPFKELADWIGAKYGVHVLNVVHEQRPQSAIPLWLYNRPRLSVILETDADALKFRRGSLDNVSRIVRWRVKRRFATILSKQRDHRFQMRGLFVIFVAFEPVARVDANQSVTEEELRRLKVKLANRDLWEISRCADSVPSSSTQTHR